MVKFSFPSRQSSRMFDAVLSPILFWRKICMLSSFTYKFEYKENPLVTHNFLPKETYVEHSRLYTRSSKSPSAQFLFFSAHRRPTPTMANTRRKTGSKASGGASKAPAHGTNNKKTKKSKATQKAMQKAPNATRKETVRSSSYYRNGRFLFLCIWM